MSDHIPDVTKMIGETPRTNLEAFFPHESMYQVCDADFTRRLERELNVANSIIRQQQLLDEENLRLQDRVKRLEDAGDLMVQHFYTDEPRSEMWEKAKEAKP
jgi:hypothetical protein